MRLSIVLSVHNRSKLLKRALETYPSQTMRPENWEVVLVDDCSTENLREVLRPFIGRMNIRYVSFDHRRHHLWKARNAGWQPGLPEDWFHTPALTTNAGCFLARGEAICLCHPEVMHAKDNFTIGTEMTLRASWSSTKDWKKLVTAPPRGRLKPGAYVAGKCFLGTPSTNAWLDRASNTEAIWDPKEMTSLEFYGKQLYWYCSFAPRIAVTDIGGVDFEYLNGVAAEDDDFRDRLINAGYVGVYEPAIQALHQDHSDEKEAHRDRNAARWHDGLLRNRALYASRIENGFPEPANSNLDWTAKECIVDVTEYRLDGRSA